MVLRLRTPDLDCAVYAAGGQHACRWVGLYTVHNIPVAPVHLRYEIRAPLPNVKVSIIRSSDDIVRVVAKKVRLLDVSRCIAVPQESVLVVPCRHAPVLEE